jgi:hypothetical protein
MSRKVSNMADEGSLLEILIVAASGESKAAAASQRLALREFQPMSHKNCTNNRRALGPAKSVATFPAPVERLYTLDNRGKRLEVF